VVLGDAVSDVSRGSWDDVILCVNCGSSSLKFSLFGASDGTLQAIASGAADRIGLGQGRTWLRVENDGASGAPPALIERTDSHPDHLTALAASLRLLEDARVPVATLVGHRIVHGGARFIEPTRIDAAVIHELTKLVPLAPLHLPAALATIQAVSERRPDLAQVACFDTAFHASMPERARRLPIPERFDRAGVQRYGFHGISYEYIMSTLGSEVPSRVVIAHLGNGSSLVAVKNGSSIDTTMGFTPTGGIMMGTRSGDLDPGVLVYVLRNTNVSVDALEHIVDHESGLTAVGGTSDVKTLLARAATDPKARLATTMFAYAVRKAIGALAAAGGGVDLLIFTGGIGERAAPIRLDACEGLAFLGIEIDAERNRRNDDTISTEISRCLVRVIPTNEDRMIARHVLEVMRSS
jgi:acetate kinase